MRGSTGFLATWRQCSQIIPGSRLRIFTGAYQLRALHQEPDHLQLQFLDLARHFRGHAPNYHRLSPTSSNSISRPEQRSR